AMRSSATAEDLPEASFAGQQETFLNIVGSDQIIERIPHILASLFTDRAISYRVKHNFDHMQVALSIGIQKMIRSDLSSSGVLFTLDTETGFRDVVYITAAYGLGENVVQGTVNPDEFYVHKPTRIKGYESILKKRLGSKEQKLMFTNDPQKPVENRPVAEADQKKFCISNKEILQLADYAIIIEEYYSKLHNRPMPMDIEWAKDGETNELFIVQARPETIHAKKEKKDTFTKTVTHFACAPNRNSLLITGNSVGDSIISGIARHVASLDEYQKLQEGDILVTNITDPNWEPLMKKAVGIITNQGGRTCHAAIVSRELNIPAIVGTLDGTKKIEDGEEITIDCSQGSVGYVYKGTYPIKQTSYEISVNDKKNIPLWVNIGNPDEAFSSAFLPYQGVGLARLEFIVNSSIKIHPMALVHPEKTDAKTQELIKEIIVNHETPQDFFVHKLAQEIGTIAAAAYPRPVNVRFSDFKSNEYRNLIGGSFFEPEEENPMIGLRGASRYYHPMYQEAFELESKALLHVRTKMGLENVHGLVPFVRTLEEAKLVSSLISKAGLKREKNGFQLLMMCEIPSNMLLLEQFAQYFDGFSIGSNDLTQLTLGVDRDSALIAPLFNEEDPAVFALLKVGIEKASRANKKITICGQAPEDHPDLSQKLLDWGIDGISCSTQGFFTIYETLKQ
ncbi:phosphoenolpyruvate synthase, partial [Candidatus Babeliales bacterium]|nr:phosphoenolpyruvate synthase [Candidatus Babeliales bacterium]